MPPRTSPTSRSGAPSTGYAGPGGLRGYWWAPDGARLLVARVDSAGVQRWHVGDPAEPGRAPRAVRYPAAGTANADVTLWIVGLDGSRTQARWDRDAFEYVPGAGWDAHGPFAVVQSRDQLTVRFLGIDPASGETTVLCEQRDACWVLLVPGSPARTASGAVISHADLDGTRHLTVDGTPVTPVGAAFAVVAVSQDVQVAAFGSGHRSAEASASRTCAGGHLSYLAACRLPVSRTAVL